MKKGLKKCLLVLLVLSMTVLTACGGKKTDKEVSSTGTDAQESKEQETTDVKETEETAETATEAEEPAMDLGGMEIIIGDWWSSGEEAEPTTAQQEATQEYRKMIQEKYNFTIKQVNVADFDTYQETFTTSTMAEDPAASIFMMAPSWISQPLANGLIYDLSTLKNFDLTEAKWNQSVTKQMTYGNSIYGMASGKPEPKLGLYWNKRLFKEAGLDPDLPYELQASGEWTWKKFEELCKKLTIDSNNDGKIDSYAMANFSPDFFRAAVISNNAQFIGKDESGKFFNATTDPNFLESLQWVTKLIEDGYEMPTPEDAEWDWFIAAFHDGKAAMHFGEQYRTGTWSDMKDDYGFVLCPKGPKSDTYATYFGDNIAVIPSCFDAETAEKIAFAYNLWTNPTPGYEDVEDWKDFYYTRFRDERAVDETLSMMYEDGIAREEYLPFVYGTSFGDFAYDLYALVSTPAEKIEAVSGMWQSLIDDANK
ncbi:MAG TPA: extracellular solute-binding protein [Lachnospiraceae bacterium]|nr:extracellular solute-binding protein [Lachnospiraceae bacterium]